MRRKKTRTRSLLGPVVDAQGRFLPKPVARRALLLGHGGRATVASNHTYGQPRGVLRIEAAPMLLRTCRFAERVQTSAL